MDGLLGAGIAWSLDQHGLRKLNRLSISRQRFVILSLTRENLSDLPLPVRVARSSVLREPFHGLGIALSHAVPCIIKNAKIVRRVCIPLKSGLAIPLRRLGIVLFHAKAMLIKIAEIGLRRLVTLKSGLAIPLRRLGIVLPYPSPFLVQISEIELRDGIAPLCSLAVQRRR